MTSHRPISSYIDVLRLDEKELLAGYMAGYERPCHAEPPASCSAAYMHGWRNGRVDAGHAARDAAQRRVAREYAEFARQRPTARVH